LPPPEDGAHAWSAPESRRIAIAACTAHIHALLRDAQAGRARITLRERGVMGARAVRPGDIAVLVRNHREAERMRDALVMAGVPAVAAGKQSLFESEEAMEVLTLLEALLRLDDDSRLRGALATTLLGFDACAIDRLDHDDAWRQRWHAAAQGWRERWLRHGPLPLVSDLCADNAARLMALHDGERRLTNLLQLGEQLQAAASRSPGATALAEWLRRSIADADGDDETQQLRLESDARRVRILTLHKSKGLEFPLVYLPFAGVGRGTRPGMSVEYQHEDGDRVLHYKTADAHPDVLPWNEATASAAYEDNAEDARLLYVGLTRAQHAVWIACGPLYEHAKTPLHAMLSDLDALARDAALEIDASPLATIALSPLPTPAAARSPHARNVSRMLPRDWWIHSFSQWHDMQPRQQAWKPNTAGSLEAGAADEEEPFALTAQQRRFAGTRFGNALHAVLEQAALQHGVSEPDGFAAWRDHAMPPRAREMLVAALREQGYPDSELDDGVALLAQLVRSTLNARLPENLRLCDLAPQSRRAELEFHFILGVAQSERVLALLHAHGISPQRESFGLRRRLEGLMTGLIDLVYQHDGRWYVLDYKSNQLPAYNAAELDEAMQRSEYLLQALIYTLALHRWLRFRLGDAYDYARDFGGIRYLFCRGLRDEGDVVADGDAMRGIHARRFDPELIEALDQLFAEGSA
ncbi:MAG: 3'-5' exonuclease, partial [Lysobacterales bacterium]